MAGDTRYGQMGGGGGGGEQVVPLDGNSGSTVKPKGLLTAISNIQQYYVIEQGGQEIPGEFLTIDGTLEYFKIGAKSGFNEGLLLFLFYPLMEFWVIPFILVDPSNFIVTVFRSFPYMLVFFNTLMCGYISKFYVGQITRKAINSLFTGRAMALFLKGSLLWILYFFIFKLGKPEIVWKFASMFGSKAEQIYYGYYHVQPRIMPVANQTFFWLSVASFGPYGVVYIRDMLRRRRIEKNQEMISSGM